MSKYSAQGNSSSSTTILGIARTTRRLLLTTDFLSFSALTMLSVMLVAKRTHLPYAASKSPVMFTTLSDV
jgi:hypothetical protein